MRIEIANLQKLFPIKKNIIKRLLKDVLQIEGRMASELSIAFVDDEKIRELNRSFLGRDRYTDVIAFSLDDSWLGGESKDNQIKPSRAIGSQRGMKTSFLRKQGSRNREKMDSPFHGDDTVRDFRGKDKICGEIVVSVQRALKMAERLDVAPEGEIYLYLIHGLLHLMGYDDKDAKKAANMHKKERDILARCGFKTYFP